MILYKTARTNERRRKILGRGGGEGWVLRYMLHPKSFEILVLKNAFSTILKVCCYKLRQLFYCKVRQVLLQSVTGITKCDRPYKVRQNTVVLSDCCCRFRSSTVCSCTHSNREGWLMRLIDFSRFLINAAISSLRCIPSMLKFFEPKILL